MEARVAVAQPVPRHAAVARLRPTARYVAGVLALGAAYYGAAKVGQTLRYTGSVAAVWPPAGLGIAALYLWGLRWWPGIFLGELVVNVELLFDHTALPLESVLGQWAGNMAEIVVGALLLSQLIGRRAALDRAEQVVGMLVALGIATAISATVGTASMLLGGVIDGSEIASFWRTWWLGDTAGGLVVLPLILTWARDPFAAWRRLACWEGGLTIAAVAGLGVLAVTTEQPLTYAVFPALIWAAFRFGPPGASLSVAITAALAIGITAHDLGAFSKQPIDHRTLSTQLYIGVAALTALFLSAVVGERERSAAELAEARRQEGQRAVQERHRIARDLHDSVSQALFSTVLHTRTAQKALDQAATSRSGPLGRALAAIAELTRSAQSEMRAIISELRHDSVDGGLVAALTEHAADLSNRDGLTIDVQGPEGRLALSARAETQLFGIGREALANVVKHAGASTAWVRVRAGGGRVLLAIEDDGRGFDPDARHPGHFGLESMQSRASEIGGLLTISSEGDRGTAIRVDVPAETGSVPDGA
jgi:signal transduction histidine kinase